MHDITSCISDTSRLQALPELDGRYAVFGRVSKGMEVVDQIRQGDKIVKATLVSGGKLVKGNP